LGLSRGGAIEVQWVFPERLATPLSGRSVVGRDDSCATVLSGGEASRRHAEFRIDGPIAAVRDLDSRNGVFVNGERVADAPLAPGDVIRCGEWIGVLVATTEPAGAASFAAIGQGWYGGATLRAAVEPARRLAIDLPIVIQGETGTGKEGTARAIHAWSGRSGPFIAVNCAALPAELAEAELFGYRKGAFTGAAQTSPGLFRAAEGGSIFLDEILDLPPGLQPKLLRVLEDRHVRALGETRDAPVDVRVIAATQESLTTAVANRRFRADLHARLDGLTVVLPPLRARREDIALLFMEFIRQYAGGRPPAIEAKLIEALCLYDWPLNVRELLLLARRLLGLHGHEPTLKRAHLPHRMLERRAESAGADASDGAPPLAGGKPARRTTDDRSEFDALIEALRREQGSVARAAALIGVSRARAYRLISAHPDFSLDQVRS
jgi:sigma-54 dependent transcriptional regulator, acetoin dehydrogenase operon transcriptional activator AcoR